MRILVLTNLYPPAVRGGYEVECQGVVDHLRSRGDRVLVLTSTRGAGEPSDEGVVRRLPFLEHTPLGSARAPLASVRAARATRATVESFRPDLVFAWNCAQIPHAAVWAAAASSTPLAFRVCEYWFGQLFADQFGRHLVPGDRGLRRLWASAMRLVNRHPALRIDPQAPPRPAAISWNSQHVRSAIPVPAALEPVLERVVPSTSRRAELFATLERRPARSPLVVYLGRLTREKGPDVAIRAIAALRDRHAVEAELVLAGRGTPAEQRELERLAARLEVGDRCSFAGQLEPPAIAELLARGHALVVPSLWEEPFPLVAIEGAAARIPVVASRVGGIPELLADGEQALLFPAGDADACADALAAVLSGPEEALARVGRAFERARELSWSAYLAATEAFVDDAVAELARSGPVRPPARVRAGRGPRPA